MGSPDANSRKIARLMSFVSFIVGAVLKVDDLIFNTELLSKLVRKI